MSRLPARLGVVVAGALLGLVVGTGPALASQTPTAVTLAGPDLAGPLTFTANGDRDEFDTLMLEVGWMSGRTGDPITPDPAALGPKYEVTVLAGDQPVARYELYPMASGGPKAYRPADRRPGASTTDGWFYAPVTLPQVLTNVTKEAEAHSGDGVAVAAAQTRPQFDAITVDVDGAFGNFLRTVAISALVALIAVLALGTVARWVHRTTR
ncbi:MAG TPA: hypothetical protein VF054_02395 [Micromonosporaceae bacterium]